MRIAILGTRGIPNIYGGFERFAEVISAFFAKSGYNVTVLSPSANKADSLSYLEGVNIVFIKTPNWLPNNLQTLYYDLKSLIWAANNNVDIVLECGYSYAIWLFFFPKSFRDRIVTNPDGIEFNRNKWGFIAKSFLKLCEMLTVNLTKKIICDNPELVSHYKSKHKITPHVIPYGAFPLQYKPDKTTLLKYGVKDDYFLAISRFTPENNLDIILDCFSKTNYNLVLIGNYHNKFGEDCIAKYRYYQNIKFIDGIYNQKELDTLRYYAKAYIHGHSAGGTNPSLLEAMACKCFVIAHDNSYNRFVLNNSGLFFSNSENLIAFLNDFDKIDPINITFIKNQNFDRITKEFSWQSCADKYIEVFNKK